MAPLLYIQNIVVQHFRTYIFIFGRNFSERQQTIELCNQVRIQLNSRNIFAQSNNQLAKQAGFDGQNFFLSTQNFLFVFFQFLRNVALSIDERLFANPCFGHFVLVRITYFNIITKYIIKVNFQTWNTRSLTLTLLNTLQKLFARMRQHAQLIQIGINTMTNNSTFIDQVWRIVIDFFFNFFRNNMAGVQLVGNFLQSHIICFGTGILYRLNGFERHFELHHFARIDTTHCNFGYNSFQIANQRYVLLQ